MLSSHNRSAAGVLSAAFLAFSLLLTGCGGPTIPPIVPVSVTVKNSAGKPLNNVRVRFVPQNDDLDGNYLASGVTDNEGFCEIKLPGKEESGCCACLHKIQIVEGPVPDETRENYLQDQGASMIAFQKSLKNRPIPRKYTKLFSTPLTFEPSAEAGQFDIVLE